jgi:starch synthase
MPEVNTYQLLATTARAINSFHDARTWKKIQKNGMSKNLDWSNSAQRYIEMYEEILKKL